MCDDGSTDSTAEVAQDYVDRYPGKFIFIRNEHNLKLAATLNHCLEYADTEYVARMDGDDLCDHKRFEIQLAFLDSHPQYSHVSSSMKLFDEDGFYGQMKVRKSEPENDAFKNGTPYFHAPTIFRRTALEKVGYYTTSSHVERDRKSVV